MSHQPLWHPAIYRGVEDTGVGGGAIVISPRCDDVGLEDLGPSFNRCRSVRGHCNGLNRRKGDEHEEHQGAERLEKGRRVREFSEKYRRSD
ncbi:unnamed protein product [Prunus armeniaca]